MPISIVPYPPPPYPPRFQEPRWLGEIARIDGGRVIQVPILCGFGSVNVGT